MVVLKSLFVQDKAAFIKVLYVESSLLIDGAIVLVHELFALANESSIVVGDIEAITPHPSQGSVIHHLLVGSFVYKLGVLLVHHSLLSDFLKCDRVLLEAVSDC
jgi:uncharacterized membrane-anchored protein